MRYTRCGACGTMFPNAQHLTCPICFPIGKPANVFVGVGLGGARVMSEAEFSSRLRVLARRCEYCGKEPCACTGPEKSEWCTWCEGWRRLRCEIVNIETGEKARVCSECWGQYTDERDSAEDEDDLTEPATYPWRDRCMFCEAAAVLGGEGRVCVSPACAQELATLEAKIEARARERRGK